MDYQDIIYEKAADEPRIARITLNRPDKLNALSANLLNEFFHAVDDFEADPESVVLIVRGAGRAFSAGFDIGGGPGGPEQSERPQPTIGTSRRSMNASVERFLHLWNLRKPTIAQIHGYCLSGGTELSGMCDLIIAAEDTQIGHIAGRFQGTLRTLSMWPFHIGMRKSKELFMTGDLIDGKEAERLGMVNKAVPLADLEDEVWNFARRIIRIPLEILTLHKHSVNRWYEIMGVHAMMYSAADYDAVGTFTGIPGQFQKVVQERGLRAALEQRDAPFRQFERQKAPTTWQPR
ncbi:MAG: enoyl-CoA hydratase/isomerase family protein [Chloroflexi bacterium]|nr:enoyl-CoA hydratase/isomerase family protein [Chloroflexota bacterium]